MSDFEIDFDVLVESGIKNSLKKGDCPDCEEKIDSKDCCCYTGE